MNKLIIVGHPSSDLAGIESLLKVRGLQSAMSSKRERMSPKEITSTLLKSLNLSPTSTARSATQTTLPQLFSSSSQITPSPVWNGLILDLMLANIDQALWGWHDSNALPLLEYLLELDEKLGFVLVYDNPGKVFSIDADINNSSTNDLLGEWQSYNEELLSFFLKHPDRCLLVQSEQVKAKAGEAVQTLRQRIEPNAALHLSEQAEFNEFQNTSASETINSLNWLQQQFASQASMGNPAVADLYARLQACANLPEQQMLNSSTQEAPDSLVVLQHVQALHHSQQTLDEQIKALDGQIKNLNDTNQQKTSALLGLKSEAEKLKAEKINLQKECDKLKALNSKALNNKVQVEENELLLNQLHAVQEELERYYLENQKLKKQTQVVSKKPIERRYYGAGDRIKQQLGYRLGAALVFNCKSLIGILMMPLLLWRVRRDYLKSKLDKKGQKLPPISKYADLANAERVKKHLSYRLGQVLVRSTRGPWLKLASPFVFLFVIPFAFRKQYKLFRADRELRNV